MKLDHIDLSDLKSCPLNVRKHGGKDVSDLVTSIRSLGVLQPLLVRKNCEGYEVVAGQRRLAACRLLAEEGSDTISLVPCAVMETRAHLGVETQRQWSDKAIARTTPCLPALFSIVTLLATQLPTRERRQAATAAWYAKPGPTFSDALAAVRRTIWREQAFAMSRRRRDRTKRRFVLPGPWAYALCQAA